MDLIKACKSNDTEKALGLIMNNDTNSIVDDNNPALIWACRNKMIEVALELIKTGHAKPEQVDHYNNTALIWACQNKMKEVAFELVSIGAFTINDLLFLKPEWVPEEFLIMHPVDVTEVNI